MRPSENRCGWTILAGHSSVAVGRVTPEATATLLGLAIDRIMKPAVNSGVRLKTLVGGGAVLLLALALFAGLTTARAYQSSAELKARAAYDRAALKVDQALARVQ